VETALALFLATAFGAVGDGVQDDTAALQATLDAAAAAPAGGVAVVPRGRYRTGALVLRSHTELRLEAGAQLLVSDDPALYPEAEETPAGLRATFLRARDATGVAVTGPGEIVGWGDGPLPLGAGRREPFRTRAIVFDRCREVRLEGFTIRHADSWSIHLRQCTDVLVREVVILNRLDRINTDGIVPDGSQRVRIENCRIVAGDDAIVLKAASADTECSDILIVGCDLESATSGLKIGTETAGDVRRVTVRDTTVRSAPVGFALMLKDGGTVEDVQLDNVRLGTTLSALHGGEFPVFVDVERRHSDSPLGTVRRLTFRGLEIASGSGLLLQGAPEAPLEEIVLADIRLRAERVQDYANRRKPIGGRRTAGPQRDHEFAQLPAWCTVAHVRGLRIKHFAVEVDATEAGAPSREVLALHDATGAITNAVHRDAEPIPAPGSAEAAR
jgi:polygalacturonase